LEIFRGHRSEGSVIKESVNTFEVEHIEAERGRIMSKRAGHRCTVIGVRPPSRARNPLVHDEEFLKMNTNQRVLNICSKVNMQSQNIEITETA